MLNQSSKNNLQNCPTCGGALIMMEGDPWCWKCLMDAPAMTVLNPSVGSTLGKYQLIRELGKGGMGQVFEAEDIGSNRRVAIKIMNRPEPDEAETRRFIREGQIAASISHPNLMGVFSCEEIDGTWVLVMELVRGGTLRDRIRREGTLTPDVAVRFTLQIVEGLNAMNALGVLHRDVKPANCLLTEQGILKVADFGLSRPTPRPDGIGWDGGRSPASSTTKGAAGPSPGSKAERTASGGTPAYASPEQMRGDPLTVASDIYSTAATLYEMLMGKPPGRSPLPLNQWPKTVPRELAELVLKCLSPNPQDRFQDYESLRKALIRHLEDRYERAGAGARFTAVLLDYLVLVPGIYLLTGGSVLAPIQGAATGLDSLLANTFRAWTESVALVAALATAYFAISESLWGATLGKAILGLRVRDQTDSRLPWHRALVRSAVFCAVMIFMTEAAVPRIFGFFWDWKTFEVNRQTAAQIAVWINLVLVIGLLAPFGRRFPGVELHGLLSRSWVGRKMPHPETMVKAALPIEISAASMAGETRYLGAYRLVRTLWERGSEHLWLGYDERLKRSVWIQVCPTEGSDATILFPRQQREGRLRWLESHTQASREAWKTFEAIQGSSLVARPSESEPWEVVRDWMNQALTEIERGVASDDLPAVIGVDRVWITDSGRVILLDFPAPDSHPDSPAAGLESAASIAIATQTVLEKIASMVRFSWGTSVSRSVTLFLENLRGRRFATLEEIRLALNPILAAPARLEFSNRLTALLMSPVGLLSILLVNAAIQADRENKVYRNVAPLHPQAPGAAALLNAYEHFHPTEDINKIVSHPTSKVSVIRRRLQTDFREVVTNSQFIDRVATVGWKVPDLATVGELSAADRALTDQWIPYFGRLDSLDSTQHKPWSLHDFYSSVTGYCMATTVVLFVELIGIAFFGKSFFLRAFGLVLVGRTGADAKRGILLLRWFCIAFVMLVVPKALEEDSEPPDSPSSEVRVQSPVKSEMVEGEAPIGYGPSVKIAMVALLGVHLALVRRNPHLGLAEILTRTVVVFK